MIGIRLISPIVVFCIFFTALYGQSEKPYFQQQVNYRIDVMLNDENHTLQGKEQVHYINNSPDTLRFIYFHLYPNAYKNRKTALAKQFIRNKEEKFHYAEEEQRGWIDSLDFRDEMGKLNWEYDIEHIDICKVYLRTPLPPRGSTRIFTPFVVKIPGDFSRLGHVGQSYQISQWYPKPAVYDREGWHPMPYLNQGEFYSEFGNYEVRIQLPATYRVAATGVLQEAEELFWLELLSREYDYPGEGKVHKLDSSRLNKRKTITFKQEKIHDFAFFCSKEYLVAKEVATLADGQQVECWAFYNPKEGTPWTEGAKYVKRSIEFYSKMVGPYPYVAATAVQGALSAGGGMEYPMVTVVSAGSNARELDNVITHEVGHNWFYGILASNERQYAWLDEGFNSYIEQLYMRRYYPEQTWLQAAGLPLDIKTAYNARHFLYMAANLYAGYGYQFPINTPSPQLPAMQYGLLSYQRTAFLLDYLYQYLGEEIFVQCIHKYYETWQFQHPGPADVQRVFETVSGKSLDWFFDELFNTEKQFDYVPTRLKVKEGSYQLTVKNRGGIAAPYPIRLIQADTTLATYWVEGHLKRKVIAIPHQNADALVIDGDYYTSDLSMRNNRIRTSGMLKRIDPIKVAFGSGIPEYQFNKIYFLPSLGYNTTDGFMFGGLFHNYELMGKRFNYMVMPMYGFESNTLSGRAMVKYDWFVRDRFLKKVRLMTEYKRYANFDKVEPALNFFYQSNQKFRAKYWLGLSHAVVFHRNNYPGSGSSDQFTRLRLNQKRKSALMDENIYASVMMIHGKTPGLRTELRYERNDKIHRRGKLGYRFYMGVQLDDNNNPYYNLYGTGSPDIARDYYLIDRAGNGKAGWLGTHQALMDQGGFMSALYSGSPYLLSLNLNYDYFNFSRVYVHGLMVNNSTYLESGLGLVAGFFDVYFPVYSSGFQNGLPETFKEWRNSIRFVLKMNLESPFNQLELF